MPRQRAQATAQRSLKERDALVLQWSGLPDHVFHRHSLEIMIERLGRDDATQAGYLGLIRAAELWDETRGIQFSTYAYWCVLNCMRSEAQDNTLIRVPRMRPTRKSSDILNGKRATQLRTLPGNSWQFLSLPEKEEQAAENQEFARLAFAGRHGELLRLFYGEGLTCRQIGKRLGVSHEFVRQRIQKELQVLRERLGPTW